MIEKKLIGYGIRPKIQMKFEYNTTDYIKKIKKSDSYFHTFLDNESLAAGVLSLKPDYKISPGMAYYVPKNVKHYFFGNTKQLVVLYFFGGPDS